MHTFSGRSLVLSWVRVFLKSNSHSHSNSDPFVFLFSLTMQGSLVAKSHYFQQPPKKVGSSLLLQQQRCFQGSIRPLEDLQGSTGIQQEFFCLTSYKRLKVFLQSQHQLARFLLAHKHISEYTCMFIDHHSRMDHLHFKSQILFLVRVQSCFPTGLCNSQRCCKHGHN